MAAAQKSARNALAANSFPSMASYSSFTASAANVAPHWSQANRAEESTQSDAVDSMRQMVALFQDVVAATRVEVVGAEESARGRLAEWERTLWYHTWIWDATLAVHYDAERRARAALTDAEAQWRDVLLGPAFELALEDVACAVGERRAAALSDLALRA